MVPPCTRAGCAFAEAVIHFIRLEKGRMEGLQKGRAETLIKLLALKFGELSESAQSRLASASPSEIETWLERVLFAATLDQVFVERH